MSDNCVAVCPLDATQRTLELGVGERLHLAAVLADEVVMVAVALPRLVVGRAGAEVDPPHEPALGEQVEHAVDARDSDLPSLSAQGVEDLLRAETALLPAKQLDHSAARSAASKPSLRERGEGLL